MAPGTGAASALTKNSQDLVRPDTRVVPAHGRVITGTELLRHRDIYKKLFTTMIAYMNMGLGAEDVVERNPLKQYQAEFGDPSSLPGRRLPQHADRLRSGLTKCRCEYLGPVHGNQPELNYGSFPNAAGLKYED